MKKIRSVWPYLAHVAPFGPIWPCLAPIDPAWSYLAPLDPAWPVWSCLANFQFSCQGPQDPQLYFGFWGLFYALKYQC